MHSPFDLFAALIFDLLLPFPTALTVKSAPTDLQKVFAERIGGPEFGLVKKAYKFRIIADAKREFIKRNPSIRVIDMGVGEPEEHAPDNVVERLKVEAGKLENRYYSNSDTVEFYQSCARYLKRTLGVEFNPETEIVHCIGTKSALAQLPFAFMNSGDRVVATVPGYPVLPTISGWLGAEVVHMQLRPENDCLPDLNELKQLLKQKPIKLFLLNSPNNPTGAVATTDFFKELVGLAHQYGFLIVQDAAYADYVFKGKFASPFQVEGGRECTLELYSLSKSFSMQGWRIGFVVSNPTLLKAYVHVKDTTDNGQFLAIQKAAIEALDTAETYLSYARDKYQRRMTRTLEILNRAGIPAKQSPGTFYLYVPVPKTFAGNTFENAQAFTNYLISEMGIVTVPWEEAGAHVRMSMTFEVGTSAFKTEDDVFAEFEERLTKKGSR